MSKASSDFPVGACVSCGEFECICCPDNYSDDDDDLCADCGEIYDCCECRAGEECGRWDNGRLTKRCSKAGSEECDFECPYRGSLYK
jgi:hypothetical protein